MYNQQETSNFEELRSLDSAPGKDILFSAPIILGSCVEVGEAKFSPWNEEAGEAFGFGTL